MINITFMKHFKLIYSTLKRRINMSDGINMPSETSGKNKMSPGKLPLDAKIRTFWS